MRRNNNHNHRVDQAEFRGRITTELEYMKRKLQALEQNDEKTHWWLIGLLGGMVVSLAILIAQFILER